MKASLTKIIFVLSLSAGYGYAAANKAPTNAELYEMLQATQQQLSEAKKRAEVAISSGLPSLAIGVFLE